MKKLFTKIINIIFGKRCGCKTKEQKMKKPLPKGKKGKGIKALKKKAPHIAKKMGYKRGGRA